MEKHHEGGRKHEPRRKMAHDATCRGGAPLGREKQPPSRTTHHERGRRSMVGGRRGEGQSTTREGKGQEKVQRV
ncbi:hypothetical protein SESBI_48513 [Sesbania bispinosa]|nr:hypothetical protein SESBI_48513 [Sesbania bispinosa]